MAIYPCDYSGHRYREAQQSLYWTEISEHLVSTYKVRLCSEHFYEVFNYLRDHMDDIEENSFSSNVCQVCQEKRTHTVQARLFPAHDDEQQLVLDVCAKHASELGNTAHVYNGEHLAAR